MNINKTKQSQDGFFYKLMAIVALAALAAIVVMIVSALSPAKDSSPSDDTIPPISTGDPIVTTGPSNTGDADTGAVTVTPSDTTGPDVTDAPGTTAPPVTDAPDDTTATTAKPPEETTAPPTISTPISDVPTEAEMFANYPGVMLRETEDAGQEYIDNIIFLGDSTTYGLKAYKMLKDGRDTLQVWTPLSGTLTLSKATSAKIYYPDTKEEITIVDAVTAKKPSMMVITLGVNGVSFMDEEQFKGAYVALVNSIKAASPDTKIILQSIFPVAKEYDTTSGINNEKINRANVWVADVASTCGVKYLYTACVLMDEDNYLNSSYHNGDYLHLDVPGFTKELEYIRTHAYN